MPIAVKEDSWEQTPSQIFIHLPLKNVARKSVDVFSTPKYIKISYPPFLYEQYLFAEINDLDSSTEITNSQIILKLSKLCPATWNCIGHVQSDNRAVMRTVRQEALEFSLQRSRAEVEKRKVAKSESHKYAVGEHMDAEAARFRDAMARRERDKVAAFAGFGLTEGRGDNTGCSTGHLEEVDRTLTETPVSDNALDELLQKIAVVDQKHSRSKARPDSICKTHPKTLVKEEPAAVRPSGIISFAATPRPFPTPQRESQVAEEEAWLLKQADYRRVLAETGEGSVDRPEERDPVWLKQKGDFFLDAGDYDSAIVCYSRAVQLGTCMPEIFMNRGLAHLLKNNLHKVLEDMSKALEIFPEIVDVTRNERRKAHWRRALAFLKLGLFVESLVEFEGAAKHPPEDGNLEKQKHFVKCLVEGTVPEKECDTAWMLRGVVLERS